MENKLTYESPSLEELFLPPFNVVAGDSTLVEGQDPDNYEGKKEDFEDETEA